MDALTIITIIVHIIIIALATFGGFVLWEMRDTILDRIKEEFQYYWSKLKWNKYTLAKVVLVLGIIYMLIRLLWYCIEQDINLNFIR